MRTVWSMEDREETRSGLVIELARARQRIDELGRREDGRGPGRKGLKVPNPVIQEEIHPLQAAKGGSNDGVAIVKEKTLLYVNDRFLEIFGYRSTDQVMGNPVAIIAHPDDQERILEFIGANQEGGSVPSRCEFRGMRKDGTTIHVEAYTPHTAFGDDSVTLAYFRDITDGKQTLETLERRLKVEELVSTISARLIDAGFGEMGEPIRDSLRMMGEFAAMDDVRLVLFPAQGEVPLEGYAWRRDGLDARLRNSPQLLPLDWSRKRFASSDVIHVSGRENLPLSEAAPERRFWEALGVVSLLAISVSAHGHLLGFLSFPSYRTERDWSEGEIVAMRLVGRILGKVIAGNRAGGNSERSLREAESRFESLAEQSLVGVCLIQDNLFKYANQHLAAMFGYSVDELVNRVGPLELVRPEDRPVVKENIRRRVSGEVQTLHYQFAGLKKDGKTVYVEAHGSATVWRGNAAVIGTLLDESDRKKLEAQLIQSEKMKAIGTLAGGIAHDFNNILMAIQGYTSLMLHRLDPDHFHYSKLKGIEELVESGSELTKQLLGFASGGTYEIRAADLNDIVRKTSTMFARTRKEITIQSRYEDEPCVVDADSGQIEQMLLNLYVNAWQAMPGGGTLFLETQNVHLDGSLVRPYSVRPGKYAKISVTDTGVGMDDDTKKRIFEPFFTTKKRSRGTGLGLASVYNIVKGHGGFINVTSEKGHGSTFTIYLPLSKKTVERVEPVSQDVLKGRETILLVDDEETVITVSKDMLEALEYSVLTAKSGQEAVALFEKNRHIIDLVILDVIMPDMGGEETFNQMKKIDPSVCVILSSGYSLDGLAMKIMDRGCKAFIQKPFTINALSQKLRDVLGRS